MTIVDGKHFPSNAGKFEFDREVSEIFPDMALRSIPMYKEVHRLHVSMILSSNVYSMHKPLRVYDIGASRGSFFKELCRQTSTDIHTGSSALHLTAVDSSEDMLHLLSVEMPWVHTRVADATKLVDLDEQVDAISMLYVLQFIESPAGRLEALRWANRNLRPGGLLILGQKSVPTSTYLRMFTGLYHKFRVHNGYTMEEVRAKDEALKNAMWPDSPGWVEDQCYRAGFIDYTETTRWLQFFTSVCTKGE